MAGTVMVSGGSGYIAGETIRQLLAHGWTVHTTVRSLSRELGWEGIRINALCPGLVETAISAA